MSFISAEEQERLVTEYLDYAKSGAKRYARIYKGKIDYEEFESVALFYLFYATTKWNPEGGTSFKSYAFTWIDAYLKNYVRTWRRVNGGTYTASGYVEMLAERTWPDKRGDGRETISGLRPKLPKQYAVVRRRERVCQLLGMCRTARQKRVLLMLLNDVTQREIAKRFNVTPSAVKKWKQEIFQSIGLPKNYIVWKQQERRGVAS